MGKKVELKKYESKYFFKFVFYNLGLNHMKRLGIFKKKFIRGFIRRFIFRKKKESYLFMVLSDGKIVGGLDLTQISGRTFNIGGSIFKKYRNKGIAKKAIKKLFIFAKKKGAKKIIGISDKDNFASIKLVKRLGYKKVRENKKEIFWEKVLR